MSPKQERQLHIIRQAGLKLRVFGSEIEAQLHTDALEALMETSLFSFGPKPTEKDIAAGDAIRVMIHVDKCLKGKALHIATLTHAVQTATITAEILLFKANQFAPKRAHAYESLRPLAITVEDIEALQQALDTDPHPGGLGDGVVSFVKAVSYETSALMAARLGAFPLHQVAAKTMMSAITNHRAAAFGDGGMLTDSHIRPPMLREGHVPAMLLTKTRERWNSAQALGKQYGYRHAKTVALTAVEKREEKPIAVPKEIEQKWRERTPLSQEELQNMLLRQP